jgi:flagellar motor switch/type III secretory pathway protein FliN
VVDALLDPAELAAVREAIAPRAPSFREEEPDARPIALIADDRALERTRAASLDLAAHWCEEIRSRVGRALGVRLEIAPSSADGVTGETAREILRGAWCMPVSTADRRTQGMLLASGPWLHGIGALRLGAKSAQDAGDRAPSPTTLLLFERIGEVIAGALTDTWRADRGEKLEARADQDWAERLRLNLIEADALLALTLTVASPWPGRVQILLPPAAMNAPPAPIRLQNRSTEVAAILAEVPIEVRVELGRVILSVHQLEALEVGQVLTLDRSSEELLPLECAGVVKAFGRPLISNANIALEIAAIAAQQGEHR